MSSRTTLAQQQRIEANARRFGWTAPKSAADIATNAETLASASFSGQSADYAVGALRQALRNLAADVRKLEGGRR